MRQRVSLWTWDRGEREVDLLGDPKRLAPIVQTILDGGLWGQFRKIPPEVISRLLPFLVVAAHTRRFLKMWVEHAPRHAS